VSQVLATDQLDPRGAPPVRPLPKLVSDNGHKVTVRFCAGHGCTQSVTTHRVRQNVHGHREYCSLICYSRWSPAMRKVIERYSEYEQSPSGLEALIMDLRRDHGIMGAAEILCISRSTVTYWLRKLQTFRQFAGQSPQKILELLKEKADRDGVDTAAKLIAVDPKTLSRAFQEHFTPATDPPKET
jgi:hypothetical protein